MRTQAGGSRLSPTATAAAVAAIAFTVGLAGDACHVASGTTRYEWTGVPEIWRSRVWFPLLLTGAVLLAAWSGERGGLPAARTRGRADAITGPALVLALYALTAVLKGPAGHGVGRAHRRARRGSRVCTSRRERSPPACGRPIRRR